MVSKPSELPQWATGGSILVPSSGKQSQGWVAEEPGYEWENWKSLRTYQWLQGLQGGFYDYVIGSSAQVTAGLATHTWTTFAAASPLSGAKVLVLEGTNQLSTSLSLANQIEIIGENANAIIDLNGYTITLAGQNSKFKIVVINSTPGCIIISGIGSEITSPGIPYQSFNISRGVKCEIYGATESILYGYSDAFPGWTKRTNTLGNFALRGIIWSSSLGLFVAVGNGDGSNSLIATSPDGITWIKRTNTLGNFALISVIWSSSLGLFVTVGSSDGSNSLIATSPDGITWTKRTNTLGNIALLSVIWSSSLGLFVAVGNGDGSNTLIATSPDGITWTKRTNTLGNFSLYNITRSSSLGLFVAVGFNDGSNPLIATSPDGITWTKRTNTLGNIALQGITWSSSLGLFVAVGFSDTSNSLIATSPDGITWTKRTNTLGNISLLRVTWSSSLGLFVAVGFTDSANPLIATSPDGITWTGRTNGLGNFILRDITWNSTLSLFVTAGDSDGSNPLIATSSDGGISNPLVNSSRLYPVRLYIQGSWKTILAVQPEQNPLGLNTVDYLLMRGPICKRSTSTSPTMNGTDQLIIFDGTSFFDTNSNWDSINHRFTPSIPGIYRAYLQIEFSTLPSGGQVSSIIRKNGITDQLSTIKYALSDLVFATLVGVDIIDCNGITDYIDFALNAPAGSVINTATYLTFFTIERIN